MKPKKKIIGMLVLLSVIIVSQAFKEVSERFDPSPRFVSPISADALINPLKGSENAIAEGKKLYGANCAVCHGPKGNGDGVAAPGLSKPPAVHSSATVQKLTDGALFWMITTGNNPMPSYKSVFTETQRWELVDFIRTLAKPVKK